MTETELEALLTASVVLPVIEIDDPAKAVSLVQAIHEGGIGAVEITLRTPSALAAITAIAKALPDFPVGAGTILNPDDARRAAEAGARFLVSPGATPELLDATRGASVPLVPGTATASDVMAALARGFRLLKFFPAASSGGVAALKSLAGPLAAARFCPTGGISATTAPDYLALSNVMCVGGSWVAPRDLVTKGAWSEITALCKAAVALRA